MNLILHSPCTDAMHRVSAENPIQSLDLDATDRVSTEYGILMKIILKNNWIDNLCIKI